MNWNLCLSWKHLSKRCKKTHPSASVDVFFCVVLTLFFIGRRQRAYHPLKCTGKIGQIVKTTGIGGNRNLHTVFNQPLCLQTSQCIDKTYDGITGHCFKLPG